MRGTPTALPQGDTMAKISTAELKRALRAAEQNRLKHQAHDRLDLAQHPKLLRTQRAGKKLLAEVFRKAGLETRKLAALQKQYNAELQRIVDKQGAEAIKRASRAKDTVRSSIRSQRDALKLLAADQHFFPFPLVTLDKPFLIWATPHSNIISDSSIEPFNSWAKIRVESGSSSGLEKLSFYFLWDNPSNFYTVINASTSMSATGRLKATAFGGGSAIYSTGSSSFVGCSANFALWSWWLNPPTSTPETRQPLGSVQEFATFWDKSEAVTVSDGANLDKTLFLVPPQGVVVLEVSFQVGYSNDDGRALADFESGGFKISCPVVVVAVLTSPSASVAAVAT
jgi:hypothetical protein